MSQHDYNIANDTGAAVRSDLNSALSAIVSNNSGAVAPTTTFAYMMWADTSTGLLKMRNSSDTAWVELGSLSLKNWGLPGASDLPRWAGTAGGTANALTLTPTQPLTSYANQTLIFKAASNNTGAATVNVSGLGVKSIVTQAGAALDDSSLIAGRIYTITYDGTNFVCHELTPPTSVASYASDAAFVTANGTAAAGDMYYNTTTAKIRYYTTAWNDVGSGSGGATNFITNPDAESATTGWTTYNDGTAAVVDGTGGTASGITFARSTTSPLIGNASFLLSRTGAALGQGVSFDFDISDAYKAKVLQISYEYRAISGTFAAGSSSSDGDLVCYIVDRTNGTVIQPSTYKHFASSSTLSTTFVSNFQTPSNSTAYRICFHIPNSTSTAFGLQIDNVAVSPSQYVCGTPITDWQSYTPTWSNLGTGSVSSTGALYRRVGDSLEVEFQATKDASAGSGSSAVQMSLPSGLTINTARLPDSSFYRNVVGNAAIYSTTWYSSEVYVDTTASTTKVQFIANGATGAFTGNGWIANASLMGRMILPIVGWSATAQQSDSGDSRTLFVRATRTAGVQSIGNGSTTTAMIFNNVETDTHSCYDASTGIFRAPFQGVFEFCGGVTFAPSGSGQRDVLVNIAGSVTKQISLGFMGTPSGTTDTHIAGPAKYFLKAGDTVTINPYQNNGGALFVAGSGGNYNYFEVLCRPGSPLMSATESVNLSVGLTSSVAPGANGVVKYDAVVKDSHSMYSASSGLATVPTQGQYRLAVTTNTGTGSNFYVKVNGVARGYLHFQSTSIITSSSISLKLNAGDTVGVYLETAGTLAAAAGNGYCNYMSLDRIGN